MHDMSVATRAAAESPSHIPSRYKVNAPISAIGVVPKPTENPRNTINVAQAGARKKIANKRIGTCDHRINAAPVRNSVVDNQSSAIPMLSAMTTTRRISLSRGSQ